MRTRAGAFALAAVLLIVAGLAGAPTASAQVATEGYGPAVIRGTMWHLRTTLGSGVSDVPAFTYGNPGDTPLMCDWNGDGTRTPGVRRGNTFYLRNSNSSGVADIAAFSFGNPTDVPVCGNWNANDEIQDDTETVGVVRNGNQFFLRNSNAAGPSDITVTFGNPGDVPLIGDWDGDLDYTVGVRRGIHFYLSNSLTSPTADAGSFDFGNPSDVPIAGDWDQDVQFTETVGLKRGGTWFLTNSSPLSGAAAADETFNYGNPTDVGRVWFQFPPAEQASSSG